VKPRKLVAASALAVAVFAAGTGASGAPPMRGAMEAAHSSARTVIAVHERVVHVQIRNFAFRPARLVVSPGTRVVWQNHDGDPHTVSSVTGHFSSPALDTDGRFARVFRTPGTYPYLCTIHPFMRGVVVVRR
jgi:plastocyanin